jgi:hypothetical protein
MSRAKHVKADTFGAKKVASSVPSLSFGAPTREESLAADGVADENAKDCGGGCASALLSIVGPGLDGEKVNAERRSVGLLSLASDATAGDGGAADAVEATVDGVGLGANLDARRAGRNRLANGRVGGD